MKKQKKPIFVIAYFLGAMFFLSSSFAVSAYDGRMDTHEEEEEDEYVAPVVQTPTEVPAVTTTTTSTPVEVVRTVPVTTYQTVVDPPTYVTELQDQTVNKKDLDKDGLIDEIDPNPTIAEYYIVQDDDGDGINDLLEYALQ